MAKTFDSISPTSASQDSSLLAERYRAVFLARLAHELRTPITAIRGQLEVAIFTAKTTDQYREAMLNALQDIDRLSQRTAVVTALYR